ncbi:MAG: hypothetical protein C0467_29700 [Planctomycetaceae bacterium]|nr:hypothetical protein [Planctomycetaceae bacterium]
MLFADGEAPQVHWFFSLKDYWYAIVSAFIGAMLGITYTRWDIARQRRKEQMLCVKRLRECLTFNVDRLNQASNLLQAASIPNYPLDTGQLNYWLTQSHDILQHDLFVALDWQRYQLDHISSKFVVASNLIAGAVAAGAPLNNAYIAAVRNDLLQQVDGVRAALPPLVNQIPQS